MERRTFIKTAALGSVALGLGACTGQEKSHILTFSFDDGFRKSFHRIADIHEKFGLRACLNVIASGHLPEFQQVGEYILPELMGSFEDWNALQERGHEIMPHSWQHLNLTQQRPEVAEGLILRCLDYFEKHLEGFDASKSVFNFPFNASTPELEEFALSNVLAIRTQAEYPVNSLPLQKPYRQGCQSQGPDNIDHWVELQVNNFLASEGGWLILNTHGLDDESWGPMSSSYLENLLQRLVEIDKLEILPVGEMVQRSIHI